VSYPGRSPRCFGGSKLGAERLALNAVEKSAEGIVGGRQVALVRHSEAERWSKRICADRMFSVEGLNGSPKGVEREEKSFVEEWRECIRRARASRG